MKKIIILILVLILGFVAIKFLKEKKAEVAANTTAQPPAYSVKVVTPSQKSIHSKRSFLAKVQSQSSIKIASKLSGFITNLHVKEADSVKKGDLLVSIDEREVQAAIGVLRANLETLESDVAYTKNVYNRNQKLHRAGGLAAEKLDASEVVHKAKMAALLSTKENIKAKTIQLDYLTLKAPYDGEVGTIFLREGDMALPGKAILSLNSNSKKLLFRYIPNNEFNLTSGQKLYIKGTEVGTLTTVHSDASQALSVAEAEVGTELSHPNGAYVNVDVFSDEVSGCSVPLNALVHKKDNISVMQYLNNRFEVLHVNIEVQNGYDAIISPCPSADVAVASEAKLTLLPTLTSVSIKK